jgi:hypothetical protein
MAVVSAPSAVVATVGLGVAANGIRGVVKGVETLWSTSQRRSTGYRDRYNEHLASQGKSPLPTDYDAHHRIPQEYRNHPDFSNFDFDDPSNIRGIKGYSSTENWHAVLTYWWNKFKQQNPNASRAQVEEFAKILDRYYGHLYH